MDNFIHLEMSIYIGTHDGIILSLALGKTVHCPKCIQREHQDENMGLHVSLPTVWTILRRRKRVVSCTLSICIAD